MTPEGIEPPIFGSGIRRVTIAPWSQSITCSASVAQWIEHQTSNLGVAGSSPAWGSFCDQSKLGRVVKALALGASLERGTGSNPVACNFYHHVHWNLIVLEIYFLKFEILLKFFSQMLEEFFSIAKNGFNTTLFPGGPPPQYWAGSNRVNFGVRMRTGALRLIWSNPTVSPRNKKLQKKTVRSPGIEPGSITWQATIITTRPRALTEKNKHTANWRRGLAR